MKKLALTTMLGISVMCSTVLAAEHIGGIEDNTIIHVFNKEESAKFAADVDRILEEANKEKLNEAKDVLKKRLEAAARSEEKQRAMAKKYELNLEQKEVSQKAIEDSKIRQAKKIRDAAKDYLKKSYKHVKCDELKESEVYLNSICKANNGHIVDALEDLKTIEHLDDRAYCVEQMITLTLANSKNSVQSDVFKNILLAKVKGQVRTNTCVKAFAIASSK